VIDNLKPHPEYKESGHRWLGQIPSTWAIGRTKRIYRLHTEKSLHGHGLELLSIYTHIGVRPRKDLEQKGNKASTTDGYWLVKKGDIIVNKLLAWMGAVGVSHYDGVTSPAYDILRPIEAVHSDYYHYLFRTNLFLQQFKSRSRGIMEMRLRLYFDQLGQIPVLIPPLSEQRDIVRFLDHANNRIERAIQAKKKLMALLNEQKQAIIHRAVTRGLNPNVPLKPSGIPWLGDIPKHWEVRKLRTLADMIVSNVDKHSKSSEERVRLCNYTNVYKNETITGALDFMVATATKGEIQKFKIRTGDVIITKDSEEWDDIGVPALVGHEADDLICGYHLAMLRARTEILHGNFLFRALQDRFIATQMYVRAKGVTRYGLAHQGIKEVLLPIPPTTEQDSLCGALTKDLSRFQIAFGRASREIELLREYRARLVADVVTGKLDVRAAAAKLPTEPQREAIIDEATEEGDTESGEVANA
jgi:type I restriction enzyme S subunit